MIRGRSISTGTRASAALWLLLAALVIQVRAIDPSSPDLARYLLLMCICGGVAAWLLASSVPAEVTTAVRGTPRLNRWFVIAAALGVPSAVISARLVAQDPWNAQWWWLVAMVVPMLALAVSRVRRQSWRLPFRARFPWLEVMAVVLLVAIALAVRGYDITSSPPFLLGDEASCGLYGRIFNAGHTPLLSISWFGLPMFSYAVSGIGLRIFGDGLVGLRLTSALVGTFGILLAYLLGKEWFGRRAGYLGAIVLAVSFLQIELSRDGIHYIQGPTTITLTLLLTTYMITRNSQFAALLAGMSLAVDVQVYWSARIAPLLAIGILAYLALTQRRFLHERGHVLAWFGLGAIVAGLPVAALFQSIPGSFNGHQSDVYIFSSGLDTRNHLFSQYGGAGNRDILRQQTWKVLTAFNARGDASVIFGPWGHSLLDVISAALLPAAVALALVRWRRWEYLLCFAWIGIVLAASAVTIDPPLWPRLLSALPAIALLVGVLLDDLWRELGSSRRTVMLGGVGLAAALVGMGYLNVHAAYVDYPAISRQTSTEATLVAEFMAQAPGAGSTVMLSDGSMYVNYEPIRFLAPASDGCTLLPQQPSATCPIFQRSKLFVLLPGRVGDLGWLQRQRPGGKVVSVGTFSNGTAHILAYELA